MQSNGQKKIFSDISTWIVTSETLGHETSIRLEYRTVFHRRGLTVCSWLANICILNARKSIVCSNIISLFKSGNCRREREKKGPRSPVLSNCIRGRGEYHWLVLLDTLPAHSSTHTTARETEPHSRTNKIIRFTISCYFYRTVVHRLNAT